MQPGLTYKHARCLDVAFHVTKVSGSVSDGTMIATGYWINMRLRRDNVIAADEIRVSDQEIYNWKRIDL